MRLEPGHEVADIAERLSRRDAHADMRRPMRDADAELEPAARDFVDIGRAMGEIVDRGGIDRRDRGGEGDALGGEGQTNALRHVAERAGNLDLWKPAPLDF